MIWPVAKRGRPRQRHVPDILSIPAEDIAGCSSLEKLAVDHRVDERFLQLLAQFTQQGRNLSDKQHANFFAPKILTPIIYFSVTTCHQLVWPGHLVAGARLILRLWSEQ
jgi:hypothetical protein